MGKYDKIKSVDASIPTLLRCIANEKAEANRLKRLELKILSADLDIPKTMAEIEEDRA